MNVLRLKAAFGAAAGVMAANAALAAAEQHTTFTVRIENIAAAGAIRTSAGGSADVVLAPGLWVVHTKPAPLFKQGEADRGQGLEAAAEDGAPAELAKSVEAMKTANMTGSDKKSSDSKKMEMSKDKPDAATMMHDDLRSGIFDTRIGANSPGIVRPGQAYEFTVTARPGCRLSLVSMYVQSNDCFVGSVEEGIPLFDETGKPNRGDVTEQIRLWDAGTEINQEPGVGSDQGARQGGHNIGADEKGVVRPVNDGFAYPKIAETVRVTITPMSMQ